MHTIINIITKIFIFFLGHRPDPPTHAPKPQSPVRPIPPGGGIPDLPIRPTERRVPSGPLVAWKERVPSERETYSGRVLNYLEESGCFEVDSWFALNPCESRTLGGRGRVSGVPGSWKWDRDHFSFWCDCGTNCVDIPHGGGRVFFKRSMAEFAEGCLEHKCRKRTVDEYLSDIAYISGTEE